MKKIFVVEDDDNIRELVIYALGTSGFAAEGFETGADIVRKVSEGKPELVLLDIMLPGSDGLTILKALRQNPPTEKVPVIMITAKGAEHDRIIGLDAGADDYITKPFSVLELISRVKAVLRRTAAVENTGILTCCGISADRAARSVAVDGKPVQLTLKEFELLVYLMINRGMVLSRDRITEHVWGYDFEGESRTVDMHIKTLRQKLGPAGENIRTVRGVGYVIGG